MVRIYHTGGVAFTDFTIINPEMVQDFKGGTNTFLNNYVSITGRTLRFSRAFATTDPQFGGTIKVPAYTYPAHISGDSDAIPVDIPNWLVFMTAAEYVRSDVTRQNQYQTLLAQANDIMDRMKQNNDGQDTSLLQNWNPMAFSSDGANNGFYYP